TTTLVNGSGHVPLKWPSLDGGNWLPRGVPTNARYTVHLADYLDQLRCEVFSSYDNGNSTVSADSPATFAVANTQPTVKVDVVTPDGVNLGGLLADTRH